jgi:hypothetical protein
VQKDSDAGYSCRSLRSRSPRLSRVYRAGRRISLFCDSRPARPNTFQCTQPIDGYTTPVGPRASSRSIQSHCSPTPLQPVSFSRHFEAPLSHDNTPSSFSATQQEHRKENQLQIDDLLSTSKVAEQRRILNKEKDEMTIAAVTATTQRSFTLLDARGDSIRRISLSIRSPHHHPQ